MANTTKKESVKETIAEDATQVQDRTPVVSAPKKSERLVSIQEFISGKSFSPEFLAGFQMYLKVNKKPLFTTDENWDKVLESYKNRKI